MGPLDTEGFLGPITGGQELWEPGGRGEGGSRMGLEEHWLVEQGVGVACAKGLGRPKCWAICPVFPVASDSPLSGHPGSSLCLLGETYQFSRLLCSQGTAMDLALNNRCSHTRY